MFPISVDRAGWGILASMKERTVIILGLLVAILPFLGFPNSWRTPLFALLGLLISVLAFLIRNEAQGKKEGGTYAQSNSPSSRYEIFQKESNPFDQGNIQ